MRRRHAGRIDREGRPMVVIGRIATMLSSNAAAGRVVATTMLQAGQAVQSGAQQRRRAERADHQPGQGFLPSRRHVRPCGCERN